MVMCTELRCASKALSWVVLSFPRGVPCQDDDIHVDVVRLSELRLPMDILFIPPR
jgi:hypothetical protein